MKTEGLSSILLELQKTRLAILQEVEYISDTQLNTKPKRETWSIMQMLHHLHLVEQAVTSNITYALRTSVKHDVPRKTMPTKLQHIKIPEQLKPTETILKANQMRQMLQTSRANLIHVLEGLEDEQELWTKALQHPMFGELGLGQWLEFHEQYEKHYLKEIQEAKRALGQ